VFRQGKAGGQAGKGS
jgi:hypothetical protein